MIDREQLETQIVYWRLKTAAALTAVEYAANQLEQATCNLGTLAVEELIEREA